MVLNNAVNSFSCATWVILFFCGAQHQFASAERVKHFSLEHGLATKVNVSRHENNIEIATLWTAYSTIMDAYKGYTAVRTAYNEYVERNTMIQNIANGHVKYTDNLVKIAYDQLSGNKKPYQLKQAIEADTFQSFKAMLNTFEQANRMCIEDEQFFKNPTAFVGRQFNTITEEQWQGLRTAQLVISDVVTSMRGVIDYSMCPKLAAAVRTDLEIAQQNVNEWEKVIKLVSNGEGWSWYEMLYNSYTGGGQAAEGFAYVRTAVLDTMTGFKQNVNFPSRDECYSGQMRTAKGAFDVLKSMFTGAGAELDEYDVEFDPQGDEYTKVRHHSHLIHQAMDRASLNLEMYDQECKRVHEDGKWGLIKEIEDAKNNGDEAAKLQFQAQACDLCMRYGCRSQGVLGLLLEISKPIGTVYGLVYQAFKYGIDEVVLQAAQHFLPHWYANIYTTLHHIENILDPEDEHKMELFCSTIFLLSRGAENFKARETCIQMGEQMIAGKSAPEETLKRLTGGAATQTNLVKNNHMLQRPGGDKDEQ